MNNEQYFLQLIEKGEIEIDSNGNIWRLKIRGGNPTRKSYTKSCPRHRIEYKTRDGYLLVTTNIDKKRIVTGAHRLVWTYFNYLIPDKMTINHKNGVKDDNHPENLELATYSENRIHAIEVLKVNRHCPQGSKHPKTFLTEADVIEMRKMREKGMMVKEIAFQYGMDKRAISAICTRKTWKHI